MAKIAIILILVGLTVMVSAYRMEQPHFDQGLQTEKVNERAQLIEHLEGSQNYYKNIHTWSVFTLSLSALLKVNGARDKVDMQAVSTFIWTYETMYTPTYINLFISSENCRQKWHFNCGSYMHAIDYFKFVIDWYVFSCSILQSCPRKCKHCKIKCCARCHPEYKLFPNFPCASECFNGMELNRQTTKIWLCSMQL